MIYTLENAALQLSINPAIARWSVASYEWNSLALENAQIGLNFFKNHRFFRVFDRWQGAQSGEPEWRPSAHGRSRQMSILLGLPENGLRCTLTFSLPEEHPLLLWQISIENQGAKPVYLDRIDLLSAGFFYPERTGLLADLRLPAWSDGNRQARGKSGFISPPGEAAFFSNGWQSWSYTGAYGRNDRFRRTRLGPLRAPTDRNAGTPLPRHRGSFTSEMFGVVGNRSQRTGLLLGFLSQTEHFGSLETYIDVSNPAVRLWANGDRARLDPGARISTDWACLHFLHLDNPDPLSPYLEAVARQHDLRSADLPEPPAGWCSWYQFSSEDQVVGKLTAEDIRANLAAVKARSSRLPLGVVQIDDGFESRVGDWFSFNAGFPDGVAPLAADIRAAGLNPGLWLAPFIVDRRARLAGDHPDWLLRNRLGLPVNAGYLWGAFPTALDLTHPGALDYACQVIQTAVHDWGFSYLKLDFLYAAALPGQYRDRTRTRAQVLRSGLEALRAAAGPDCFLLGCGCPLGPAIGLVDAMRISTDTSRRWSPSFKNREFILRGEPNLPAARNATHNTLTRAGLHRRWWINDPDCLLLRPETQLTLSEVQTIATLIALSGGSLFLSDHLPDLPPERLAIAEVLLPLIGKRPHVLEWFDRLTPDRLQLDLKGPTGSWHLLALFNWQSRPADLFLRLSDFYLDAQGEFYAREFWRAEILRVAPKAPSGGRLCFKDVPPHGNILLAVRPARSHHPQYLGSDLHISQGLEVSAWDWEGSGGLIMQLRRPGYAHGHIDLAFPRPLLKAQLDGQALDWEAIGERLYRFAVEFDRSADLFFELEK